MQDLAATPERPLAFGNPPRPALEQLQSYDPRVERRRNREETARGPTGRTACPAPKPRSLFAAACSLSSNNLLIYVLLASAVVTILLRHALDAVVILAVVLIKRGRSAFIQEGAGGEGARRHSRDADPRGFRPARWGGG